MYDFKIHTSTPDELEHMDLAKEWNMMRYMVTRIIGPTTIVRRGSREVISHGSGHIQFAADYPNYNAGYYCYLLGMVISQDIFDTKFRFDPLKPKQFRRYREIVLENSDDLSVAETLENFLGRPVSEKAYFEALESASRDMYGSPLTGFEKIRRNFRDALKLVKAVSIANKD